MPDHLRLWLGRHGEASDPDTAATDFDRVLTPFGRTQVSQLTRWLITREESPELILHSPLVRARQTAEIIASEIPSGAILMEEPLLSPGFSTPTLLRHLSQAGSQRIVCIGHQPDIGRSLSEIVGGGRAAIAPGTLAGIEFQGITSVGAGTLRWLADPSWFGG
jgi:phosphohistidine phosphatase